jgi:hypothetical protein
MLKNSTIHWFLDSDPSIRWQVMRDLTDAPAQAIIAERRRIATEGNGEMTERDRKGGTVWTRFAFPTWWHYEVLRGLEYLRLAGAAPDRRAGEAIDLVASKRDDGGRWPLEIQYPGTLPMETAEAPGRPSRWIALRASRVLAWYSI